MTGAVVHDVVVDPLPGAVYRTSPLKRFRRTRAQLRTLDDAIVEIVLEQRPMTVRQVFYQAEVKGLVGKSEDGYNVVQRRLVELRGVKAIPWSYITDGTRWVHGADTYGCLGQFMEDMARTYRRDVWREADERVEVWIEKDALSGVLLPVAHHWGVPLYVTRGFASLSYLQSAADQAIQDKRPVTVLLMTDLDPSGIAIAEHVEVELTRRAAGIDVTVERLAVHPEQVVDWHLPTRPTKPGDSRGARFAHDYGVECTELDAIGPAVLRSLVSGAIAEHAPAGFDRLRKVEAAERETLKSYAAALGGEA